MPQDKNFVFQRFDADSKEAERAYHDYWEDFETPFWEAEVQTGRVKYSRSSLFLYHWLTARTIEDFTAREVFTQFKHYVTTKHPEVKTLLPQLKSAADSISFDGGNDRFGWRFLEDSETTALGRSCRLVACDGAKVSPGGKGSARTGYNANKQTIIAFE